MPDEAANTQPTKLFVGCFEFVPDEDLGADEDDDDGTFQLVIEARDVDDAAAKSRARLHEIAATTDTLRGVMVYTNVFVEIAPGDLVRGVLVNHQTFGDSLAYRYLPEQGATAATEHFFDDETERAATAESEGAEHEADAREGESGDDDAYADEEADLDDEDADLGRTQPVFWAKWKLYWCETGDGDEDWFVVARSAWEAAEWHENEEGYDRGDAGAEFVCVLPDVLQLQGEKEYPWWPSKETLLACGAEFIPHVPQDGCNELRMQVGSGARVVRINGRIYSEGDIVNNTRQRLGAEPDA